MKKKPAFLKKPAARSYLVRVRTLLMTTVPDPSDPSKTLRTLDAHDRYVVMQTSEPVHAGSFIAQVSIEAHEIKYVRAKAPITHKTKRSKSR